MRSTMRSDNRQGRLALATALLAFVLGLSGAAMADQPATFAEALAQAKEQDKPLVVDFYTDW
jgi:hypothetical protein